MLEGHGPRRVDLRPKRREHADAPIADLIAEAFDHDGAVVGHHTRGLRLLIQVGNKVAGSASIEPSVAQPLHRIETRGRSRPQLPRERPECSPELQWSAGPVAMPEGHLPWLPGGRGDDHLLEGDVLDAPRGGAEQERLPWSTFVDHLLVELTNAGAVGQGDGEEPTIRDRAGVGYREPLCPRPASQRAFNAVPNHAGA